MSRVALVGAGCGRGLLTLRGCELLAACSCVIYDSLLDEELLSLTREGCVKIFVGKRAGAHSMRQEEINGLLLACARRYPLTVRLKGGDPFVFGRGGEEVAALTAADIPFELVPGVTSAVAAAELAAIPVTHRGVARSFTVITAHTMDGQCDFTPLAKGHGTLVFLMGKGSAHAIQTGLLEGGMSEDTPAAILSMAGMPEARTCRCRLQDIADMVATLAAPLVIVVGEVCREGLLGETEGLLSCGPQVVVTGTRVHVQRLVRLLEERGIRAEGCVTSLLQPRPFDSVFEQLDDFDWLVFTSSNGVDVFFERARRLGVDHRVFARKQFAVIGSFTAERLLEHGFRADLVPGTFTAASLTEELTRRHIPRERVALLRAAAGSASLLAVGTQISLYDTLPDRAGAARAHSLLRRGGAITFASASGAKSVLEAGRLPDGVHIVCIGEETARTVRAMGYVPVVAERACAEYLADAVEEVLCRG